MIEPGVFAGVAAVPRAVTGSFLDVGIHRLPREASIVSPGARSGSRRNARAGCAPSCVAHAHDLSCKARQGISAASLRDCASSPP